MRILSRHRLAPALAGLLLISLAGCNTKPTDITAEDTDDQKDALAHAKPVELPPSILASKSYRCKDNSVVYIDWFSGDKQASVKAKKDGSPTMLKADEAGKPFTADGGYAITGSAKDGSVDVTLPGKGSQSCKA